MMTRYVVAGIDGSRPSLVAAAWAAQEAASRGMPLRLVHAEPLAPHLLPTVQAIGGWRGRVKRMVERPCRASPAATRGWTSQADGSRTPLSVPCPAAGRHRSVNCWSSVRGGWVDSTAATEHEGERGGDHRLRGRRRRAASAG